MKKIIFTSAAILMASSFLFTSCNKKSEGANPDDAKENQELTNAAQAADEGDLDDYSNYLKNASSSMKKASEALDSFSEGNYSKLLEDAKNFSENNMPEDYKKEYDAVKKEYEKIQQLKDSAEYKEAIESGTKALESANKALDTLKSMGL